MWANRDWVGTHLPANTPTGRELAAYSRLLTAVEGNTTFYAVPSQAAVARWSEQAPADFRFCFKLPRTITHDRRLRHAENELAEFLERLGPIHDRLGPTSIQLPASFGPDDIQVLAAFLSRLPSSLEWAVELRHPGFFVGGSAERPVDDLLREYETSRVILDSRAFFAGPCTTSQEREAWERKPRLPVRPTATGPHPTVRFIGRTDAAANPEFWAPWVDKLAAWCDDGLEPYFFMHTPDNAESPGLARLLQSSVSALSDQAGSLPEPPQTDTPVSLF